ncbi:hypothetical protein TRVA0_057S00716 [Trichomonascus vanleenenianus]|uniref:separase n=1 Tax=Trichomonascus vanleenenianus TaxID=2268995 RepID=UPI003EC9735C
MTKSTREVVYDELTNINLESLGKLKRLLNASANRTLKPQASSRSLRSKKPAADCTGELNSIENLELARQVVEVSIAIFESIKKAPDSQFSDKSKKYIHEAASTGIGILYESGLSIPYDVERIQLSFILKLLDLSMIEEALAELWILYTNLPTGAKHTSITRPSYDGYFKFNVTAKATPQLANVVVSAQVLLLKAVQKCAQKSFKPISNMVIANSVKDPLAGPIAWCEHIPEKAREQKLTLIGKLIMTLSNTASLPTALHIRLAALRVIPNPELSFYGAALSTFEAFRRQKSFDGHDFLRTYGDDILYLARENPSSLRSEKFVALVSHCRRISSNCNDPELLDVWSKVIVPSTQQSPKGLDEIQKTFDQMKTDVSGTIFLGILKALSIPQHLGDPAFHKSVHSLADRMISDSRIDLFNYILNGIYVENLSSISSSRYCARMLESFLKHCKGDIRLDIADMIYQSLDFFADIFVHFECYDIVVHVSNTMLNVGTKLRSMKFTDYLKYWQRSSEIEIQYADYLPMEKSLLPVKVERLALALITENEPEKALDMIVQAMVVLDNRYKLCELSRSKCQYALAELDQMQRLINIICRLLLDLPELSIEFNNLIAELEALLLDHILMTIVKSSSPNKQHLASRIVERLWSLRPISEYPLRALQSMSNGFHVSGEIHPPLLDCLEDIIASVNEDKLEKDTELSHLCYWFLSQTLTELCISHSYAENELFNYLEHAVDQICDVLEKNELESIGPVDVINTRIGQLSDFLLLQGAHDLRATLLQSQISKLGQTNLSLLGACYKDLAYSQLLLGYTTASFRNLQRAKNCWERDENSVLRAFALILEVEYYVAVTENQKARQAFDQLASFILSSNELSPVLTDGRYTGESLDHFQDRVILFALSTNAFAHLHSLEGNTEVGVVNVQKTVRLLQGYVKRYSNVIQTKIWPVVSLLIDSLITAAKLFEELGIVRESLYYVQEAVKLCESSKCNVRLSTVLTLQGEINVRMGKIEDAQKVLHKCEELMEEVSFRDVHFLQLVHSLALYLQRQCLFSEENVYYDMSEAVFAELVNKYNGPKKSVEQLANEVSRLRVTARRRNLGRQLQQKPAVSDTMGIDVVHNTIVRRRVFSLGLQDEMENADEILQKEMAKVVAGSREEVLCEISKARNLYLLARRQLTLDPVMNVIQDSALSIPSISSVTPGTATTATGRTRPSKKENGFDSAVKNLVAAKEGIINHYEKMLRVCSSIEIADASGLFNCVIMLLQALMKAHDSVTSALTFKMLELSKGYSTLKDRLALELKASTSFDWPNFEQLSNTGHLWPNDPFTQYLPSNWLVASINVSMDNQNLLIARYESSREPFMISLPLNRHSSRDADEDSFSFDDGLSQIKNIIRASNASAHISRTSKIKTKEDRKQWWEERFELDNQLQSILHDVEYCWLGGFKGIFSRNVPHEVHAEKFNETMTNILNHHLPSRRKRKKTNTVNIHPRVFELFMGLGHPDTLSDPGLLEDLIYYVLDVLQFHGEQNAYDELDIDQIVIEVEEALRHYHSCLEREPQYTNEFDHIVIVLDKSCHDFPWENIPLLRNCSVSRVPSMQILSELLENRQPEFTEQEGRFDICPSSYYYILNPGRDLVKTQERFEQEFNRESWFGKVAEPPAEDEIIKALEHNDMYIYMGHGGGEQYIRSAKVKSLKKCAPTLLLGCSSGALESAGDYDSWGTPVNYMIAGCPMLVANMWDVTDKDIDKFSLSVLQKWGALDASEESSRLNMGEAVSRSRDECMLKYLNGGAPVIYGLPLRKRG